jgi:hypothetical protein
MALVFSLTNRYGTVNKFNLDRHDATGSYHKRREAGFEKGWQLNPDWVSTLTAKIERR